MRRNAVLLIVLALTVSLAQQANGADVPIFTNFAPGMTFNTGTGNWVGNTNYPNQQLVAQQFVPSTTAKFSSVMLALSETVANVTHTAHVYLVSDVAGLPGTILEQINVPVTSSVNTSIVTATSALKPVLSAGTSYWLVVAATRTSGLENAQLMWYANSIGEPQDTPVSKLCQVFGATCSPTAGPWYAGVNVMRTVFQINGEVTAAAQYNICLLYDQTKAAKSGSTVPIRLQLCDSNGQNQSSSTIGLHAISITHASTEVSGPVQDSGNSNPDSDFRFDASLGLTGGYIYNLSTKGLSTGTYNINFTVTGGSFIYTAPFQVK